ncbi:MAG TPA: ATP-grasp domain-containing protein, partial [Longimicrobiaceae bacterium]|nr:ATP-grasp domain-containing protein [Longimicrobiaceae bacterium]
AHPTMSDHLLVFPPYRAFSASTVAILKAAGRHGITLSVLTTLPPEFFAPYPCVLDVVSLPGEDTAAAREQVRAEVERLRRERPFRRAVTFSEDHVELCAEVNERYGLGGGTVRSARLSRDKYLMRGALAAAGVPVPAFRPVSTYAGFAAAVAELGFPCISKPVKGCASEGVVKLEEGADLRAAWEFTSGVAQPECAGAPVLVEEYVPGTEYSVEIVVSGGRAHVAGITDKTTEPEPFFGEVMHVFPAAVPPELERRVAELADATVRALEMSGGGAHLEFRLSPRGPVVMECAARIGGDSIPIVVMLASGVDLYAAVLLQALGREFSVAPRRAKVGGIRFVQTEAEGTLRSIAWDGGRLQGMRGILGWGLLQGEGDYVARPPKGETHRLGFLLGVAASQDAVKETLAAGAAALTYSLS